MTQKYTFEMAPKILKEIQERKKDTSWAAVLVSSHCTQNKKKKCKILII